MKLDTISDAELLALMGHCEAELWQRGVIRTSNLLGDLAEKLVCVSFDLEQASFSQKHFDGTDAEGKRYQIKARRLTRWSKSRELSALRDLSVGGFDFLVGVLFDEAYNVKRAALMPYSVVKDHSKWAPNTNSHTFRLTDDVLGLHSRDRYHG